MERATKLLVLGWALAAVAAQLWLVKGSWPGLFVLGPCAFVAAATLSAVDRRAVALVLLPAYAFPALVRLTHGPYHVYFGVLWMAGLLGAVFPDALRTSWRIPAPWRAPLVCWALVVMAGASIVAVREIDFTPALIDTTAVANTPGGGWPKFLISWTLQTALTLLLGILWFDWLLGLRERDFLQGVAVPLAVSALALAAVSIYQLAGDFRFLNVNVFGGTGRASGSMLDANVSGMIAALWSGGFVLLASRLERSGPYVLAAGLPAVWLAVWASGSRTAFLAAVLIGAASAVGAIVAWRGGALRLTRGRAIAGAAVVLALIVLAGTMGQEAVGPARRLGRTLPSLSTDSVRDFAAEIWNRNRYGTVSTGMIREFPAFGVGVGSFHFLMSGYVQQFSPGAGLIPDNAQNWYRHQVAEVGFVGSLGWMAWVFAFGWFVMQRHPGAPPAAWPARAALVAFAAVSFVGMPAQDLFVAVTFWTMAFWYVSIVGAPGANVPVKPLIWPATALVVFVFAAGTGLSAVGDLRVPHRAQRSGWPYSYGFYPPEPDGAGGHRRWAGRRAAAVVPATTRWMALTASVDHLAIGSPGGAPRPSHSPTRPVDAKVWSDGTLIVDERLTTTAPVTRLVEVPADEKWVLIETWVSRTIDPRDLGIADDRELGLLVSWTFLDAPPERLTRALE